MTDLIATLEGLTADQMRFLRELQPYAHPATRRELAFAATRAEDKVRQSCRRLGLVEIVGGFLDGRNRPMGWRLTPSGRALLRALEARDGTE